MQHLIRTIIKSAAYVAAALVIMLALAVGLFRLMLPRLPEYQDSIKSWANAAIGMQVQFEDMDARWRLRGPELTFRNAELTPYDSATSLLSAGEVSVGVSLLRLLRDRELVVDRIELDRIGLSLQFSDEDGWLVQGRRLADVIGSRNIAATEAGEVVVLASEVEIDYQLPNSEESLIFILDRLEISRDSTRIRIDAAVDLPRGMGNRLDVSAVQRVEEAEDATWQFYVEARGLDIPGAMRLAPGRFPVFRSGTLDMSASVQRSAGVIRQATADFVISELSGEGETLIAPLDAQGRLEYSRDDDGWLLAGSNFVLSTVDATWPRTTLSLQVAKAADGALDSVTAAADYLNLDDLRYLSEWLPPDLQQLRDRYDPSGVLRDAMINLDALQSGEPRFDIAVELVEAGVAATSGYPGARQLSGLLRADNAGGRLEISAEGMVLDLPAQLDAPIAFDDAIGTVIWRRNQQGITVLSDSVRVRNADLDSNSSLQISIPSDGSSPDVDFRGTWSVNDVSAVRRYLPAKKIKPGLYQWLSTALVAGYAPQGTMVLSGPLDKFPFDQGEGVFRIEAHLEETTLRYANNWPDVENMTLDVVVDGMRLYSDNNSAVNAGNSVIDAKIEIADLRRPVLTVDAYATGSLESIRRFSRESPISAVFGGHLDKVTVAGDAAFNLQLTLPIIDKEKYDFSTRIQVNDGTLSFEGFPAPLRELNGVVKVSRESVTSELLFGTFLGNPVDIELRPAGEQQPGYSIVAVARGRMTDSGLFADLAPQLEGFVEGAADYTVNIKFPKADSDPPSPLQIAFDSTLEGITVKLPAPLDKSGDRRLPLAFTVEFPETSRIETYGNADESLIWAMTFRAADTGAWDFDRGSLAIGGTYPSAPDTRGLHITGETDYIDFDDWLAIARRGKGEISVADRIRSIDLTLGHLYVLGQDLQNHRVQVERSAEDWFVTVAGSEVSGTIAVPYDFASGRPLVVDMESLVLPGWDEKPAEPENAAEQDPRAVPTLLVSADEFALGARRFGALDAEFRRTGRGLESTKLLTRDATFTVEGSAGWLHEGDSSFTYLNARLQSNDIRTTMDRLNYQPGITGDSLRIDFDLRWPGPPREDFLEHVGGRVSLDIGSGQLDDVEPGAGRVFGLMSIVALPRRLSLDFTDVFEKGFGFDRIKGSFRIDDGQAYTCDLSLEGPAADVGIVGRAGLATRDYTQAAIVSANVGNTLPVIGAVIAGPQVAAALLVFSQIFKKPLQDIGQVYYGIDGSWDEPVVASADVARFAENSSAAGCISDDR